MSILSFLNGGDEQDDIIMLKSLLEDGHGLVPFETWGKRSSKKTSQTAIGISAQAQNATYAFLNLIHIRTGILHAWLEIHVVAW